ncbi:AAA family ATPase [Micromonospora tulbaghiae]|uniref:AAA family ATPase n=1 Tax=Micromonospora tulbaghiae TaxID=479978 RepID=UPI00341B6744
MQLTMQGGRVVASGPKRNEMMERLREVNQVFLPARPVSDQELLAGRNDQLFNLLEMTFTPGAHAAIYGERGVGKTSVAAVFEIISRVQDNLTARINCNINEDFGRIWINMADHILDVAARTGLVPIEVARDAMDTLSYSQAPADVVRYLRRIVEHTPLVLIFDEFDIVGDAIVSESFANLMKAISDLGINAHLVIVGVAEDIDALLEGHASVARGLHQIKIPRLNDDELFNIIDRGAQKLHISFDDKVRQSIVTLSQGLPHYTHLLAQQAARWAIIGGRDKVLPEDWQPALSAALRQMQQQILDLYHIATASAKQTMFPDLILACALAAKDIQGFFRPTDVVIPLQQVTGKQYQIPGFVKNLAALAGEDRGPILETKVFADRRPRYRFKNPLLQPYVLIKALNDGKRLPGFNP